MSFANHYDLNAMLDLQKLYLMNLTKMQTDADTSTENDNAILNLSNQLTTLEEKISDVSKYYNILTSEKETNAILNTETERLRLKEKNINEAITGQRRVMFLNINYQKRYAVYTKMVVTLVIGLVIYFIIKRLADVFTIIPSAIYKFLIIIDFVAVIITIAIFYHELSTRDLMNYDEIVLKAPNLKASGDSSISQTALNTVNEQGIAAAAAAEATSICSGQSCCGPDGSGRITAYDATQNKCTVQAAQSYGISNHLF